MLSSETHDFCKKRRFGLPCGSKARFSPPTHAPSHPIADPEGFISLTGLHKTLPIPHRARPPAPEPLIRNAIHSVAELEIERYDVPG
jgi:hypothetical protein